MGHSEIAHVSVCRFTLKMYILFLSSLLAAALIVTDANSPMLRPDPRAYCGEDGFRIDCNWGQVPPNKAVIYSAKLGRMTSGHKCLNYAQSNIGCERDVADLLNKMCGGVDGCVFVVEDLAKVVTTDCQRHGWTTPVYLEVDWECR